VLVAPESARLEAARDRLFWVLGGSRGKSRVSAKGIFCHNDGIRERAIDVVGTIVGAESTDVEAGTGVGETELVLEGEKKKVPRGLVRIGSSLSPLLAAYKVRCIL
jgi:hypothetical protein